MNPEEFKQKQQQINSLKQEPPEVARRRRVQLKIKHAFWDFESEGRTSVQEFLKSDHYTKAIQDIVAINGSNDDIEQAVTLLHEKYGSIESEQEIASASLDANVDVLREETQKETSARSRELDAKYSVVQNSSTAQGGAIKDMSEETSGFLTTAEEKIRGHAVQKQGVEIARIDVGENILREQSEKPQEEEGGIPKATKGDIPSTVETRNEVGIPSIDESVVLEEKTANQEVGSVEQIKQSELFFSPEIKKSFEDVIESNVRLLQKLEERENDGLNYLLDQSAAFQYGSALARIRDNQKLDEALRKDINLAAEAISEFGVSQEPRLIEDVDSLGRLDDVLANVAQDIASFGKKLRDTYGDKAEPHIHALVRLMDNLDLASQRLRSRKFRVQDYIDR